jgi:uncharacterized protein YkwD
MRIRVIVSLCMFAASCAADGGDSPAARSGTSNPQLTAGQSSAGRVGSLAAAAGARATSPTTSLMTPPPRADGSAGTLAAVAGAPALGPGLAGRGAGAPPTAAAGSGAATTPAVTSPTDCPAAPADAPASAVAALAAVNKLRVAAGSGCATLHMQIVQAATSHCAYYETNNKTNAMCTANPHAEVMGCTGFTGASPVDRMRAAGFMSNGGGGEVMAFLNNPEGAVQTWVDSVWHRIPILDPATNQLGYGASASCDTIDFGPNQRSDAAKIVVYPYDGQTDVTTSFNGQYEGPMPPAPTTGWPSANPITLYAQKPMITEHVLTVDGTTDPIEHVWLDSSSTLLEASDKGFLRSSVFMYANKPFTPNTKYRVKMSGTYAGGTLMKEWTFTTGAAPTRGGRR